MRRTRTVPRTDLNKLSSEVLSRGCEAALPQNLPDRWLRLLGRDVVEARKAFLEENEEQDGPEIDISGPLLIVVALLSKKNRKTSLVDEFSTDELMASLDSYGRAIQEEIVGRQTGVFLRQYTVENVV
ncbi:hypothetical protein [Paucimonas lemoignei]|uniref:hypothetical protein n=1 Tax=Paucimonas lemoignei TaxID=29443 RepID=UPI0010470BBF|nr:hypothetical protein [Paucimonas lemoignei]